MNVTVQPHVIFAFFLTEHFEDGKGSPASGQSQINHCILQASLVHRYSMHVLLQLVRDDGHKTN
jgi:hypothetical protein